MFTPPQKVQKGVVTLAREMRYGCSMARTGSDALLRLVRDSMRRCAHGLLLCIAFARVMFGRGAMAQSQAAEPPGSESFEVAAIRMVRPYSDTELKSGAGDQPLGTFPADRFVARHVPLDFLVSIAFNIDMRHVMVSENWQDEQLYDIAATVQAASNSP